jgi:hypothetical protein
MGRFRKKMAEFGGSTRQKDRLLLAVGRWQKGCLALVRIKSTALAVKGL